MSLNFGSGISEVWSHPHAAQKLAQSNLSLFRNGRSFGQILIWRAAEAANHYKPIQKITQANTRKFPLMLHHHSNIMQTWLKLHIYIYHTYIIFDVQIFDGLQLTIIVTFYCGLAPGISNIYFYDYFMIWFMFFFYDYFMIWMIFNDFHLWLWKFKKQWIFWFFSTTD